MTVARISTRSTYEWRDNLDLLARGEVTAVRSDGALQAHQGLGGSGQLAHQDWSVLSDLERAGILVASVYSYSTPIAVCLSDNQTRGYWVMLPGRYTKTTSRHQNVIRGPRDENPTVEITVLQELLWLAPEEREVFLHLLGDWHGTFEDLIEASRMLEEV